MHSLLWRKRCSILIRLPWLRFSSFFSSCLAAFRFGWSLSIGRSWRNINRADRWRVYREDNGTHIGRIKWNPLKWHVQLRLHDAINLVRFCPLSIGKGIFSLTFAAEEMRCTLWLGLGSASSNTIRGFRLCTKTTLSGLVLKSEHERLLLKDAPMTLLSPRGSRGHPPPAGRTPAAGSGEGLPEAGNRSCVPRSSERPCRTRRTWALHLCPHHSTPWRTKWKIMVTFLQLLELERPFSSFF